MFNPAGCLVRSTSTKCPTKGLCEPDSHVFAKLFEDRLERGLEAQALSGREIGGDDANGRLRRWLPRQIDIDQVSDEEIQDI